MKFFWGEPLGLRNLFLTYTDGLTSAPRPRRETRASLGANQRVARHTREGHVAAEPEVAAGAGAVTQRARVPARYSCKRDAVLTLTKTVDL